MVDYERQNIGPNLLIRSALEQKLTIFLCGPGYRHTSFATRKAVESAMAKYPNVDVVLGEKLENIETRTRKADLQTIESAFARQVDFTCLMVESPGAIAELGTFSMDPDIRMRLYALVPNEFYSSESYIARGPLSVLAANHPSSVIYYDRFRPEQISEAMKLPLLAHKFLKHRYAYKYRNITSHQRDVPNGKKRNYETLMKPYLEEFYAHLACVAIISLDEPTFPELVSFLKVPPNETSKALKRLFDDDRIIKNANGRYVSKKGYADEQLYPFNTTQISKMRANILAAA